MKKFTLTLLAIVCALCCAFGLVACGPETDGDPGNQEPEKKLTAEQWKTTFVAAQSEKNFYLGETYLDGEDFTPGLSFNSYSDSASVYYKLESASVSKLLIKKADRYYAGTYKNSSYDISELSSAEYSQAETVLLQDIAPLYAIMKGIEDSYADFKYTGRVSSGDDDASNTFEMSNFSFTVGNKEYTAKSVTVEIEEKTNTLKDLTVDITIENDGKTIIDRMHYVKIDVFENVFSYVPLPEFIGKTFTLEMATVDKSEYAQYIIGNPNNETYIVAVNAGKTATFNADGSISGDIKTSETTKISDFTYTEEYGAITVTNKDKVSNPEDVVTLTGKMEYASGMIPKLVLTMKVQISGEEVTATFTYFYADSN